ncbi:PREDICTED: tumor necrosis factor receptor superfamily member 10A-like [Miniopterus natalensis]|uniref:tumor necrosis factor receptor superfamily member 10A-like n=1 Tax=Miniopterus natalensis TaxID=291302 RepID=UPI0007A6CB4C|nr:PREDICTED: tumor necrosis factor receptor superfamily member 10A-like [Miniopterus natalensis]
MNCTSTNDSICQCQPGFFFHHLGSDDACRPCSRCPKGEVALHGCNSTADTVCDKHVPVSERIHWYHLLAAILPTMLLAAIPYRYIMKQGCRGVPAACCCLHIGRSEGHGEGRKRMVLESPRPFESLHENGDTDSTVLSTGVVSPERLSEGSLDMGPEAPILPRTLEHWAGVDGPQAAAGEGVWAPHWSPPPDPSSSHWV